MQLLHQTWRSRIDRLNAAAVMGGSSGKYGDQQRFSASTSRPMSSVRQKRYADRSTLAAPHLVQVAAAFPGRSRRRVGRDHLGHHLLADLDALLDEREVDGRHGALARKRLDSFLCLVPHVTGWNAEDSLCGVGRPIERRDERVVLVVSGDEARLVGIAPRLGRRADLERRASLLLDHLSGEVERDRVELHHARALLDTRLDAAALVGVPHCPEALSRIFRPAKLAPVVGGFRLETAFDRRDPLDDLPRDHLEIRGAAHGALHGVALRGGDAARAAHRHGAGLRPLERHRLGQRLRSRRRALRHEPIHRIVDDRARDHRVPLLERKTKHPGARDPLDLFGDVLHPLFGFGRPSEALLGAYVEPGHLEARRQQDIAGCGAEAVLQVAPQSGLILRTVDAAPPDHEEPGIRLARVVDDLLEGLPVEQRFLDRDTRLARHPFAYFEMGLIDLRESGVDDFLVELVLLLEAKDLRRLLGEDVDDPVEDGVVEVGIVDGDGFDLLAELARQVERRHERAEGLGASVDADEDRVALGLARLGHVLDDPDVAIGPVGDTLADRADHAVAGPPDSESADHDEIVLRAGEILEYLDVMFPVHHPRLELEALLPGDTRHAIEIAVGDELQAHRDEAVVDLPLALQLHFVDVLLGQGVLHLPEAVVVQACRVDMAADQFCRERLAQRDGAGDGAVGVVGIIDGNVDALVHRRGLTWWRPVAVSPYRRLRRALRRGGATGPTRSRSAR